MRDPHHCDYCEQNWVVQAWRTNMQVREWMCEEHYTERSQMYAYRIEIDRENERIRAEAYSAADSDPQETDRLVATGMQILDRILTEEGQE